MIYFGLILILAVIDWKRHIIPNCIVIPGIVVGIFLTGNWHWSAAMFCLGWIISSYNPLLREYEVSRETSQMKDGEHYIYGGDVKLMAMIGAFLGIKSIGVVIFAWLFIALYRSWMHLFFKKIPVAPFTLVSSLFFMW